VNGAVVSEFYVGRVLDVWGVTLES
jgi:hypothetical protein